MGKIVGMDIGTTNSVVAVLDGVQARVLDSVENKPQVPSVVGLRKKKGKNADGDGEIVVGDVAEKNHPMSPTDTIYSVKRLMGRGYADTEVQKIRQWACYAVVEPSDGTRDSVRVVMGGKQYSPVDISAMILKKLKEDAEFRLGDEVTHAVITVPAYFNQAQKAATRDAGLKAGLTVIQVLDEPTAAAISYGTEFGASDDPKYVLVYDLGGGTFDISVLLMTNTNYVPVNLQGEMWLGGDNFDQVLVDHAVRVIKDEYEIDPTTNQRFMVELRRAARAAKEQLSSARSASIILPGMLQDETGDLVDVEMDITREEYERMIKPLVDKTVAITKTALDNAKLTPDMIELVLMAGNATCIPMVQQAMESMFGPEKVMRKTHPKHSVAMGAAILAQKNADKVICVNPDPAAPDDPKRTCGHVNPSTATICEGCKRPLPPPSTDSQMQEEGPTIQVGGITAFSYGIQTVGDKFHVFIDKGNVYPTEQDKIKIQSFYTRMPNQRIVSIPVYGGEHMDKASANEKQGECLALLPSGLPEGSEVRIKLWLDGDMVFDLDTYLADGTEIPHRILRGEADQKSIEALQELEEPLANAAKNLPREEAEGFEAQREDLFRQWAEGDYQGAGDGAKRLGERIAQGTTSQDPLTDRARGLIGFTEGLLHRYGWAFDPNQVYRLNKLVEDTRAALESGDSNLLAAKVAELDAAANDSELPKVVKALMDARWAIGQIRPHDPVSAANFADELEEIEDACRYNKPGAVEMYNDLSDRLLKALDARPMMAPINTAVRCWNCSKEVPSGAVRCPSCGANQNILRGDRSGVTSGRLGQIGS